MMTTKLLRKPFGTHGRVHEITPQSAGSRTGVALVPRADSGINR